MKVDERPLKMDERPLLAAERPLTPLWTSVLLTLSGRASSYILDERPLLLQVERPLLLAGRTSTALFTGRASCLDGQASSSAWLGRASSSAFLDERPLVLPLWTSVLSPVFWTSVLVFSGRASALNLLDERPLAGDERPLACACFGLLYTLWETLPSSFLATK
ncbi:hypothetical protein LR48_Vigan712s000200 [Vigna angularis]|uniref:Uncharacterized protein n=1 Tax=Phaseolus angularis TaxID=3914 RepID=A0A0L9TGB4_PHAAN|nr:hypothetical protein LR48_Vigan712s000200 [Vigna angularis]